MSPEEDHERELEDEGDEAEEGHLVPVARAELAHLNHTATDVTRKEKVICLTVRHRNRVKTWKVPQVSIRIAHPENLLKYFN